jgi:TonB family protein
MSDTRPSLDQLADAARLALARGDRDSARASLTNALQSADASGTIESETAESLLRLGALYQEAGLDAEAERLFGDAVAVAESTLGEYDLGLAAALSSLGTRLVARSANEEAEPLLRRALDISERHLGADHPDLNGLLNVLSRLYLKQGAFARAEPLLERLLVLKRVKGEEHPEVATVLASLALVRQGMGDHEGAEQLGRRVLQIREKTLAPNHYAIASALELVADECAARGKVEEAGRLYQRALSIREQTLGVSHASLRVLRERIVDLQLQAADLAGDDSFSALVAASPVTYLAPQVPAMPVPPMAKAATPSAAPVPLPASAASALPPTLSIATRTEIELATPTRLAARAPLEFDDRDEQRQQALVLPAATGQLSLQEELQNIENEMNAESAALGPAARFRSVLGSLSAALSTRRGQAVVAGTTVVILLLAALSAQPRAAERGAAGSGTARASERAPDSKPGALPVAASTPDSSSTFVRTSAGSVALRPASNSSSAPASSREQDARSDRESARRGGDEGPSLELSRNLRLPAASVSVAPADSIARASEAAPKPTDGFSKQFWSSGIDKRATEATGPTSARLLGPMPEPAYPVFLRKNNVEGEVVVQFVVDESGKPDMSTFEVVRTPHDAMTASVRKVIEQARFEPARTGGTNPKPRTEVVRSSFLFKAGGR